MNNSGWDGLDVFSVFLSWCTADGSVNAGMACHACPVATGSRV